MKIVLSRSCAVLSAAILMMSGAAARAQITEEPVPPPPGGFAVESITAMGPACAGPAATAVFTPDGAGLIVNIKREALRAVIGPGPAAVDPSQTCRLDLDLKIPVGYRINIRRVKYHGYGYLDAGVYGTLTTRYWFLGTRAPARAANLQGFLQGTYTTETDFGAEAVYSLCNLDRPLTIVTSLSAVNLVNPQGFGYLDSTTIIHELTWSKCER